MTEYEDPIIGLGGEHPKSWNHASIKSAFDPLVVQDAIAQSDKYWAMRVSWEEGVETFIRSINTSLAQAWSGPAAEQSRQAIQDYIEKHARPVTPALEALSNGVSNAAEYILNTKRHVGDPLITEGEWFTMDGAKGFFNSMISQDEADRRTAEAQQAMTTQYVEPFGLLDQQVPVIPVPVGPTSTTDIPAPPPGGYNTDTGNPSTTTSGNPNGTTPGDTPNGETPGTSEDPQGETPGEEQNGQPTTTSPGETATNPAGTETPSTAPTVPASTTPAGVTTGPGSPGGTPSGTPGMPGSPGTPEAPGPGRTVQGGPTTGPGAPAGVTAAGGTTAAGTRGMGGMPMGAAGAGRGGGQDDESNRSVPDYLINQENTDELLGEIPPTIEGGVIGSNPE
ncbi:hypothetical protein ACFWPH_05725 [Nocardia sp. NPDC058499]|uniref:hypothetical protein n=1 Tax=Nocardia sp. NPDC058499 TaxID=3346530 RepID=UPI0036617543